MKALIAALALSTSLAIGTTACAHQQLTNQNVARTALPVAAVVGLVLLGAMYDRNGVDLNGTPR
ncbi:MAG TPA: hypothetical protein VMZ53_19895 [Kofleriaceae bacterium]|nr:hypothetical protein [Kofleriaceae bacterium]